MKRTRILCITTFLLSLLFLYSIPAVYAQTDMGLPDADDNILAGIADSETMNENKTENIESLTLLLVMYSEQLEEYDRSNGVFVITCISFCGVVLGIAITLVTGAKEIKRPNLALAAVFALLPSIMTLCLYVFSMQCRRVAIFRGYLAYLEEKLSNLTGVPMIFNREVVPKFFGEFLTNICGPVVMILFIILLFIVSIWLCAYFAKSPKVISKAGCGVKAGRAILWILFALCIVFCVICAFDLATNDPVPGKVYEFCINN